MMTSVVPGNATRQGAFYTAFCFGGSGAGQCKRDSAGAGIIASGPAGGEGADLCATKSFGDRWVGIQGSEKACGAGAVLGKIDDE